MKNTKKLYETIMTSVAKQVKKALNENEYDNNGEIDIQADTERWCDIIDEYLWDHTYSSADVSEVLGLFATLVYLDQLADEEIKEIAVIIMNTIFDDDNYDSPVLDDVFIEPVAEKLKDVASDWCADVINEWRLNQ